MRVSKNLIPLAAVAVLAVGCSSGNDSDSDSGFPFPSSAPSSSSSTGSGATEAAAPQKALPVQVTGPNKAVLADSSDPKLEVTPEPATDASFTEKVKHKLREDVLRQVKVPGKTSADCPKGITLKANAVSTCNVTYEGATVPYEVKISKSYKPGSFMTFYNSTPKKGLLVADAAYGRLWETYKSRSDASKISCEELPAAKAFDFGKDTGLRCQYWSEYGGDNGDGGFKGLGVKVGTYGVDFYEVD
ncbi:hypothetical protein GTY65_09120 [Streptomyces sp. SID8379]|uniref:hypothetical protein n=1 Tax=unclassified Streptomyces TaxID=2593676 RepID=UPI00036908A3|nr:MULTISPECIES: hypothetical protein [unclassified Streptomyces]MYW64232.1 hypothetical protein [Streptomyces sp. SID8379]